jgi:hypothetical protein
MARKPTLQDKINELDVAIIESVDIAGGLFPVANLIGLSPSIQDALRGIAYVISSESDDAELLADSFVDALRQNRTFCDAIRYAINLILLPTD